MVMSIVQSLSLVLMNMVIALTFVIVLALQLNGKIFLLQIALIIFFFFVRIISKRILTNNGKEIEDLNNELALKMMTAIRGRAEIIIENGEYDLELAIKRTTERRAHLNIVNFLLGNYSKYIFETVGLFLMLSPIFFVTNVPPHELLFEISLLLISYQRLLPALQTINQNVGVLNVLLPQMEEVFTDFVPLTSSSKYYSEPVIKFELRNGKIKYADKVIKFPSSISLESGELNVIVGPSGSGKTSLVNVILGLQSLFQGKRLINSKEVDSFTLLHRVKYISQNSYIGDYESSYDFFGKTDVDIRLERIMGPGWDATKPIRNNGENLSGGQKKRLLFLKALYDSSFYDLLFLDEITSGLDEKTAVLLYELMYELAKTKIVVVVTHDKLFKENVRLIEML